LFSFDCFFLCLSIALIETFLSTFILLVFITSSFIVYILIIPYFTLITDTPKRVLNRDILSDTPNKRSIALVGTKIFVHGIPGG